MATTLLTAAVTGTAIVVPLAGVLAAAVDPDERALEMLMQAVSFSPWGAVMVYIAWQMRRDVTAGLTRMAGLWDETLDIVAPWADRARDLTTALRDSQVGDEPRRPVTNPRNKRPKTAPQDLPPR